MFEKGHNIYNNRGFTYCDMYHEKNNISCYALRTAYESSVPLLFLLVFILHHDYVSKVGAKVKLASAPKRTRTTVKS